ncbi:hypothetical protein [Microbacterium thalassium]|uniref:Vacuolar-type H+-ATPase subunit E/Vma4 n=1 Tax=Microbacterium thalassium TaxID=362649 RepID=A0A7X0KVC9_9MICO|nr:hypothetical protein [Microbacterium thalassium]MBB6392058.1 vacuolar-type H+-ATPase subunit E/Vma4 [Microbacterium thalassium]GLK24983.1 hypothetical protein GCM10017607_23010 [Microbacterium thalassium]
MSARRAGLPDGAVEAMEPLRNAIAADAERRADEIREGADEECAAVLQAAHQEAARIVDAAIADGRAAGEIVARDASARARRGASGQVLARREAARQQLRDAVMRAARGLAHDERYPDMRRRLEARGRALLGPDAVVTEHPAGGVVVEAGSRRLDLSLPALAEETWERMPEEMRGVWSG